MTGLLIALASFLVAALTFFTGFGLGTLLLPLFILFFPAAVAVAATAVVHLANNLFKAALIGKYADFHTVLRFGIPAVLFAIPGAWLLGYLAELRPLAEYTLSGRTFMVMPVKLTIGILMVVFSLFELSPELDRYSIPKRWIPLGGALSGFFGGLSGYQGALRTIFLAHSGLEKKAFIATVAVIAVMVDVTRIIVYGLTVLRGQFAMVGSGGVTLVGVAIGAAFLGTFLGLRLLQKVTMRALRTIIGILLLLLGAAIAAGLV